MFALRRGARHVVSQPVVPAISLGEAMEPVAAAAWGVGAAAAWHATTAWAVGAAVGTLALYGPEASGGGEVTV
jgi:hypothetical protein